jgi:hypothetical protein
LLKSLDEKFLSGLAPVISSAFIPTVQQNFWVENNFDRKTQAQGEGLLKRQGDIAPLSWNI